MRKDNELSGIVRDDKHAMLNPLSSQDNREAALQNIEKEQIEKIETSERMYSNRF